MPNLRYKVSAKSHPSILSYHQTRRKVKKRENRIQRTWPPQQPPPRLPPNALNLYTRNINQSESRMVLLSNRFPASTRMSCESWPEALETVSIITKSFGTHRTLVKKVICSIEPNQSDADFANTSMVVKVRTYRRSFEINSTLVMLQS